MITSVAHQQTMCKTAVTDLHYIIHPLPSALVGDGKRILQDIHEGKLFLAPSPSIITLKCSIR